MNSVSHMVVFKHVHTHTHTHIHTYTCTHIHTLTTYTHSLHIHTYTRTHIHTLTTHTHTRISSPPVNGMPFNSLTYLYRFVLYI